MGQTESLSSAGCLCPGWLLPSFLKGIFFEEKKITFRLLVTEPLLKGSFLGKLYKSNGEGLIGQKLYSSIHVLKVCKEHREKSSVWRLFLRRFKGKQYFLNKLIWGGGGVFYCVAI